MAGAKLIELRSPPPWGFQDSGQTKHYSRLHDRNVGSRHATSRAVVDTAHRADQINVQVSRACRQVSVQSASLLSPRQPEPCLTCGLDTAERTNGREEVACGRRLIRGSRRDGGEALFARRNRHTPSLGKLPYVPREFQRKQGERWGIGLHGAGD
jgi:hypothetical protein